MDRWSRESAKVRIQELSQLRSVLRIPDITLRPSAFQDRSIAALGILFGRIRVNCGCPLQGKRSNIGGKDSGTVTSTTPAFELRPRVAPPLAANEMHLTFLRAGFATWNNWRQENPYTLPDLNRASLIAATLHNVNLSRANLSGADLREADLSNADLDMARLVSANLRGADLTGANLRGVDLTRANLRGANLSRANLQGAILRWADLRGANLDGADLDDTDFRSADLGLVLGLYQSQLASAHLDQLTIFPKGLLLPSGM